MPNSEFRKTLTKLKRQWQTGLMTRDVLRLAGWLAVVLVVYSMADFFLAISDKARVAADCSIVLAFALVGLVWIIRVFILTERDMAERADRLLKSRRHTILSAFELELWYEQHDKDSGMAGPPDPPQVTNGAPGGRALPPVADETRLTDFLIQQNIAQAAAALKHLGFRDYFPFPEIKRQFGVFTLELCIGLMIFSLNYFASTTILQRIVFPLRDIPPYSHYTFKTLPPNPSVLYGGNIEMTVEIGGGPVKAQVWFVSRYQGKQHTTACFQEGPQRFAQRLEKVVSPVEFCFAMGKARSKWQKVNLLLEPTIAVASINIIPPPYTRLPGRRFFVGSEDVAGIKDSRAELFVTSNRPLLDGHLAIKTKSGLGDDETIRGTPKEKNTVMFEWNMTAPAVVEVFVRDLQGTQNRQPYRIEQKIIPDNPPVAAITEPASFSLATPTISIPLKGYAEDDLGLRRVEIARAVVGYRDRIKPLGPEAPERRFEFNSTLDLKSLGSEVGQILEFYLEASDLNPSMMGVAASDIVRVQIISDDEYAAILRARSTVDKFMKRYRIAESRLTELKEALRELKKAAEAGTNDVAATAQKLDTAKRANQEVADLFEQMAKDFSIYDIEKSLASVLSTLAQAAKNNTRRLEQAKPSDPGLGALASKMLDDLGESEQEFQKQVKKAEEVELVALVMDCARQFRMIVTQQAELVRRLSRYEQESGSPDLALLASLGRRQDEIRAELEKFVKELTSRAGKLPDQYRDLRSSAIEFAGMVNEKEIPGLMKKAVTASENQQCKDTYRYALLALEKLQELTSDSGEKPQGSTSGSGNTCFGRMCKGSGLGFEVPKDIKSTLEQMLAAMAMQAGGSGQGDGEGGSGRGGFGLAGGGMTGGDMSDGYWMGMNSPLNIPMFGPARTSFESSKGGSEVGGGGKDASCKTTSSVDSRTTEKLPLPEKTEVSSKSMPIEDVPEKYREAVKRYFSGEE